MEDDSKITRIFSTIISAKSAAGRINETGDTAVAFCKTVKIVDEIRKAVSASLEPEGVSDRLEIKPWTAWAGWIADRALALAVVLWDILKTGEVI